MRLSQLTLSLVALAAAAAPLQAQSDAEIRLSLGHVRAYGAGGYVVAFNGSGLDHIYGRSVEVLFGLTGWYAHAAIASRPLDSNGRRLFGIGPTLEFRTVSLRHRTEFYAQATGQFAYSSVARYTVPVTSVGSAAAIRRALGPDSVPPTPQVDEAETRTGFAWGFEAGIRQPIDRRVGIVASVVALRQRLYTDSGRLWLRYQLGVRIGRGP